MVLFRRLLGEVLRRHRQHQGRTLRDVAAVARVSLGYLSEVERGVKEASSELLTAVCDALGVSLADVLREVSDDLVAIERRRLRPVGFAATRPAARAVAGVAPMVPSRATASAAATRPDDGERVAVQSAAIGFASTVPPVVSEALSHVVPHVVPHVVSQVVSLSARGLPVVAA